MVYNLNTLLKNEELKQFLNFFKLFTLLIKKLQTLIKENTALLIINKNN